MILYACVASGTKILAELDRSGNGKPLALLAAQCLLATPRLHALYTHTVGHRIYAFIINQEATQTFPDPLVFFAIADVALGRAKTLLFLRRLRDSCKSKSNKDCALDFNISSLVEEIEEKDKEKPPLLPPPPGMSARDLDISNGDLDVGDGHEMNIEVLVGCEQEHGHLSAEKEKKSVENIWRQHVRVVLLLDVAICSVMFGIWFTVCRGFQCIRG